MALEITFINEVDYWASSFAEYMSRVIKDGYLKGYGNDWAIVEESPKTLNIQVDTGEAFLTGRRVKNPALSSLSFAEGDATYDRIDLIVLEVNILEEEATLKIVQGTPAAAPVEPTLTRTSSVMQYALKVVPVVTGASAVDMDDATDVMDNPSYFGLAAPVTGQYQEIVDITCPDLNKVIATGASGMHINYLNTVEYGDSLYYLASGSSKKMNLSTYVAASLTNCAGALVECTLYGGDVYGFLSSKRYKYSISGDSWTNTAISANDSSVRKIAVNGTKLYSFANAYSKVVEIDIGANTYTQKAALPAGTVTSLPISDGNGKIYFVIDGTSSTAGKIYVYDIATDAFTKLYEGKLWINYADNFSLLKIIDGTLFICGVFNILSFVIATTKLTRLYSGGQSTGVSPYRYTWMHPYKTTGTVSATEFAVSGMTAHWLSDGRMYFSLGSSGNKIMVTPFYPLGIANKTQLAAYREKPHPEVGIINLTTGTANDDATAMEEGDYYGMFTAFPEEVLTGKVTLYG